MEILVIGGGAAGLTAAIAAARRGARVTLLEKMKRPGTKLLMTGNGRCNLTHLDPAMASSYASVSGTPEETEAYASRVLRRFGAEDTLRFFLELGVPCRAWDGFVYPRSREAHTVLAALLRELVRLKVRIRYDTSVSSIAFDASSGQWAAETGSWTYTADRVILAAGGCAAPKTGSDGSGYALSKMAGHSLAGPFPALTGVLFTAEDRRIFGSCGGVRTKAGVFLEEKDMHFGDSGEIQWTGEGLSGIVIFQMSRYAALAGRPLALRIDLAEELSEKALAEELALILAHSPDLPLKELFMGFVPEKLAASLASPAVICMGRERTGRDVTENHPDPVFLAHFLKNLPVRIDGTRSFDHAQVTAGGVPLAEVHPDTMESKRAPGLFLAGEILDADGRCGGYNLQWAWSTGYIAGNAASV